MFQRPFFLLQKRLPSKKQKACNNEISPQTSKKSSDKNFDTSRLKKAKAEESIYVFTGLLKFTAFGEMLNPLCDRAHTKEANRRLCTGMGRDNK